MQGLYAIGMSAGLHGAKVAIMGRRQQVIQDSAEKLQSEGVEAIGVQVLFPPDAYACLQHTAPIANLSLVL